MKGDEEEPDSAIGFAVTPGPLQPVVLEMLVPV